VTGATGFIGNRLISFLLKNNIEIVATSKNVKKARKYDWYSKVKYISWDINNSEADLYHIFNHPDCLIHLAWEDLNDYNNLKHFEKSTPTHYKFIKKIVQNGLKHVVVIGTCLEYGMKDGCLSEDLMNNPVVPYALAKDVLRQYLEQLFVAQPVIFQWIRLFYPYGPGQGNKSLISQLDFAIKNKAKTFKMSAGEQLRDYLAIEKVAEYIAIIALQNEIQGIVNCCSGIPISIRKFVENYLRFNNYQMQLGLGYYPYPDYEPMAFWGDNKKLNRILQKNDSYLAHELKLF